MYILANEYLLKNKGTTLKSDKTLSPSAVRLWESLTKKGLAKKTDSNNYEMISSKISKENYIDNINDI